MAELRITSDIRKAPLLVAMQRAADSWPESRRDAFYEEWKTLEAHGAEMVECVTTGRHLGVRITHDFTAHCAKFGIYART